MIKIIALVLLLFITAALVYAATLPDTYRYEQSTVINASADSIYPKLIDFRQWDQWSPWSKIDPEAEVTYEGPETGTGAVMRWSGNNKVGAGSMTILETNPGERVKIRLDFLKPMKDTATSELTLAPQNGGGTMVTWSMYGDMKYIGKVMNLVMNCEKMIEDMYAKGLSNLKTWVETGAPSQ
jgi:hypothetical protein